MAPRNDAGKCNLTNALYVRFGDVSIAYAPIKFFKLYQATGADLLLLYSGKFFLLRKEYNQYCQWAVEQLPNLRFNTQVDDIHYDEDTALYRLYCSDTCSGSRHEFLCKKLVLGTGPSPHIPECCQPFIQQIVMSGQYLEHKVALQKKRAITILGSGQSAAEIFYDLLCEIDRFDYQLNWLTRSPRFLPLEYTKLTLEMTSPEYVDYFYHLPPENVMS